MNRFRKILALLLTIVLLLSLGGCRYHFRSAKENEIPNYAPWLFCKKDEVFFFYVEREYRSYDDFLNSFSSKHVSPLPLITPPLGYAIKNCAKGRAEGGRILTEVPPPSSEEFGPHYVYFIEYEIHKADCFIFDKQKDYCTCWNEYHIRFYYTRYQPLITFDIRGVSPSAKFPAMLSVLTMSSIEFVPCTEILEAEGANVLSPFCLPMIPFRLLRILLKELVKAAFAFGIGWLFVLFVKRRKKSTPTK